MLELSDNAAYASMVPAILKVGAAMEWELLNQIQLVFDEFIEGETKKAQKLWKDFLKLHPADGVALMGELSWDKFRLFFASLDLENKAAFFAYFTHKMQRYSLALLEDVEIIRILRTMSIDDVADLFNQLSGGELQRYLKLLRKRERERILSLLQFDPRSAGGIMDPDVLAFDSNLTVDKAIKTIQKLQPRKEVFRLIFLVDGSGIISGYIRLEDLVLKSADTLLSSFAQISPAIFTTDIDQEDVAKEMRHYDLDIAPVVDGQSRFLGVITGETLVHVIGEEASEDLYRMSALHPIKNTYFETSFKRLFFERSGILILLLLAQSLSSTIIQRYEATLAGLLMYFITMLISTGGNSSSQTSALVIQGMASGEVNKDNMMRFLRREILMAVALAFVLGVVAFARAYYVCQSFWPSFAVSSSLSAIVTVSVVLGSAMPIMLKKLNIDPAFSAGPFLATLMDIVGVFIYCYISTWILF